MLNKIEDFENIFDTLHEAVCIVNEEGEVMLWSSGSEKLYDVKKDRIIGKKLRLFFPQALLLQVLKNKKAVENVLHSPRKGSYVNMSAAPLFYNGKIIGAVATDRDLSEAVKLEADLSIARQKVDYLQIKVDRINEDKYVFDNIIGKSEVVKRCIDIADQISKNKISVLITGESGTGKEVFARAIHKASMRKGDFIAINCSAVPETLFESEMFGYEEGSFTGASSKGRTGKIELANNGTLFLDEIGDMPLYMQAKLLRVLQEKQISKIGSDKTKDLDIRVISATNQDLKYMVENKTFRKDLYYRLNAVMLELPSLSQRKEDIPDFINHFLMEFCMENSIKIPMIEPQAIRILSDYSWPGNIREVKNVTEHLTIFAKDNQIISDSIPEYIKYNPNGEKYKSTINGEIDFIKNDEIFINPDKNFMKNDENFYDSSMDIKNVNMDLKEAVRNLEIEIIKKAMIETNNNKYKAAKLLNIPRSTLYYKINFYNMQEYK